jgi:hypothetical protein
MLEDFIVRKAQVIEVDDSQKDGKKLSRIKVKIYPELKDVKENNLPYATPYFNGYSGSTSEAEHNPPEKDSWVLVACHPKFRYFYYLGGNYIEGFNAYQHWDQEIKTKIQNNDIPDQTYPQPRMRVYPDGNCEFWNTETGSRGFIHNSGTYSLYDSDGNAYTYMPSGKSLKVYSDQASIEFKADGSLDIDCTSASDINITANNCNVNANKIYLGGDSSTVTEQLIKGTQTNIDMGIVIDLLKNHFHLCPQAPSGTLPCDPSTVLIASLNNPLSLSNDVYTK